MAGIDLGHEPVLIVGAGLAGLVAARRLHTAGLDVQVREARERLGGRILSVDASGDPSPDGFDLGPSWFWPRMQPALASLVADLGLRVFPQNSDGDLVFQRMSRETPQRYRGMRQEPESMRVEGGTAAIVAALAGSLPSACVRTGARLVHLARRADGVDARFVNGAGVEETVRASHVILAAPPRLLAATVTFDPPLEPTMTTRWRETPTWMAPHAKCFAIYARPFWREAWLSGSAQSMVGPLVEIHDSTTASGQAALFGFVGVPAAQRRAMGQEAIVAAAVRQLVTLFGPDAATPTATLLKDWATDPLTATAEDAAPGGHPLPLDRPWVEGAWRDRLSLAGSETSDVEPGYLAGAVQAAERAAREVLERGGAARWQNGRP